MLEGMAYAFGTGDLQAEIWLQYESIWILYTKTSSMHIALVDVSDVADNPR